MIVARVTQNCDEIIDYKITALACIKITDITPNNSSLLRERNKDM
jgi:hypothetical protein